MASLFIPKVYKDAINEKLGVSLKFGLLANDLTDEVSEIKEWGDTVNFPKFKRVAKVGEITKGTAVVPSEVDMTENPSPVKHTGGSIRVYDRDAKQIKGKVQDNMVQQLVDAMDKDLDDALGAVALSKATKKSKTTSKTEITSDEIINAFALFGDDMDVDTFAGIAINSRLLPSFIKMAEFTSVDKTYQGVENGIIRNGLVGYFMGIPVYLTNNNTWVASECVTYIIKKGALGYARQKDVSLEIERESKLFADDLVVDSLYAVSVTDSDGIVLVRNTVA